LRTYEIRAFDPILLAPETGGKDAQIMNALEKYVRSLETVVQENPYEWFNFYDFWG
jgi:predicted LPLAT superfamily acyltransferase